MSRMLTTPLLVLAVTACGRAEPGQMFDSELAASLDSVLRRAVGAGELPGVVALVTDRDSVLYRSAFGVMDATGAEPMRPDAIFYIASMTKPITSLAAMMLVEEGAIALDDPASTYVPELADRSVLIAADSTASTRPASRPVTVRDLLRHTSGFGYTFSNAELLRWTQVTGRPDLEQPLLHDPGERWTYGASTYFVGRIIEEVSGQSLPQFLQARILGPLGMADTSFDLDANDLNRMAAIYVRGSDGLRGVPRSQPYQSQVRGDYGLLSTADDYARFLQVFLGDGTTDGLRLIAPETMAEMTRDQLEGMTVTQQPGAIPTLSRAFPLGSGRDGFGLGFQIAADSSRDRRAPGSLSWAGLRNTHFWVDPTNGLGVVLLTQVLPFYDDSVIDVLLAFEETLYGGLDSRS